MGAAAIDQGRRGAPLDVVQPAAGQGVALLGQVDHRRGEVDLAVEPGLDRMAVGGGHIHQVLGLQGPHVALHQLGRQRVGSRRDDHHQGQAGGDGGDRPSGDPALDRPAPAGPGREGWRRGGFLARQGGQRLGPEVLRRGVA